MQEYRPKEVRVNMNDLSAIVVIDKKRDAEELIRKYNEFIMYKIPKFDFNLMINQVPPMIKQQSTIVQNMPPKNIMSNMNNPNMLNMYNPHIMNPNMKNQNMMNPPKQQQNGSHNMHMNPNMIFMKDQKNMNQGNQPYNPNINQMVNKFNNMNISKSSNNY